MEKKKLIILSDYGLDDAVALCFLWERRSKFSAIDILPVAGNVTKENSLKNAIKLVSNLDGDKDNIRIVSTDSIAQKHVELSDIHGSDGIGDLNLDLTDYKPSLIEYDTFIGEILKTENVILSLGPLTVTNEIIKTLNKADFKKDNQLIIMAGMIDAEPNYMGMEFNQALDTNSYNECIKNSCVVATLDTARLSNFNLASHRFKENSLLNRLINKSVELAEKRHKDNSYIYDFIASLYLFSPKLFKVEVKKDEWGNTVPQLRLADEKFSLADFIEKIGAKNGIYKKN